ncbi:MAG: Fe-S cluster assembly protein SufD [Synechococcaceae cyanobacterium RL_1_2]|nr:Fe-S cluster assembly protein SufD [Synechococcaceae cyanobacterium RL_1_2]
METPTLNLTSPSPNSQGDTYLRSLLELAQGQETVCNEGTVSWLHELRQKGAYQVAQSRLPNFKDEEWRFTDVNFLKDINFTAAAKMEVPPHRLGEFVMAETEQSHVVFVNGHYAPELSNTEALGDRVYVGGLKDLPIAQAEMLVNYLGQPSAQANVFSHLNTAAINDVAIVWVQPNAVISNPLQVIHLAVMDKNPMALWIQPRTVVVMQHQSQLQLVEHYGVISDRCSDTSQNRPYFTNGVTEIFLDRNASLHHSRIQRESGDSFHIANTAIVQHQDSRYTMVEISLGAKLARHNINLDQLGPNTESTLNGLSITGAAQVNDLHSQINLNHINGTVDQLHKCIVDQQSRTVFNGKIIVPQAAQMTNATQLNRNLVLSDKARVNTKPELQITADNVKCAHGATVSQLEPEEVFYLQSRGLTADAARHLLVDAFAGDIISRLPLKSLQQRLTQCVACRTIESV